MKPQAYIIGVGPSTSEFLTERARDRIARSAERRGLCASCPCFLALPKSSMR
jgi:hypothetical protein